jgi:hypothetical protein
MADKKEEVEIGDSIVFWKTGRGGAIRCEGVVVGITPKGNLIIREFKSGWLERPIGSVKKISIEYPTFKF